MIEINLIKQREPFKLPLILGIDFNIINWKLVILFFMLSKIPAWFVFPSWEQNIVSIEEGNSELEKRLSRLRSDIRKNDDVVKQLDAYNRQVERLRVRGTQVEQIIKSKTNPKKLLEKIARDIPKDMWLNEINISPDRTMVLKGETSSYRSIGDFILSLNESAFFGNSLEIGNTQTVDDSSLGSRIEVFDLTGKIQTFDPWVM
jgi:hypothetical protein